MMQMYHGHGADMTRQMAENYGHSEFHSGELRYDYPPCPPCPGRPIALRFALSL
jgi:hypothetical protein